MMKEVFEMVETPPSNVNDYVEAIPDDIREKYVISLVTLLRQDTFHIKTTPIPIAWLTEALDRLKGLEPAKVGNYRVMMQRVLVNLGEAGEAFGIFYLERSPQTIGKS